jgi:multiple sugar transport system ATP-binding protein
MADLELREISKQFDQQFAVRDINLHVQNGELVVLLGPSGCGKSTLMRLIAGLETPTHGQVLIGGQDKTALRPKDRNVALVFQSYALYPHLSIYENIAFPLRVRGMPDKALDEKVLWAARLLDIERLLQRKPRQTSGGERQRTALARSLVRDPAVFLLDEPLSNLDAKMRHAAREELRSFQHQVKATWIHVTHDQTEAMGLGDRIVVMDKGRVRQIGTPSEIYQHPADTFVATFVGSPPMNLIEMGDYILGFRPESCLPTAYFENETDLFKVSFQLQRAEYLGNETLLYALTQAPLKTTKMIARIPSTLRLDVHPGDLCEFAVRSSDLRFFSAGEDGVSIHRPAGALRG